MTNKQRVRHTATGHDVQLIVKEMPALEMRHHDWLIEALRESPRYNGRVRGENVYFADTGAFLGFILSGGIRIHAEWYDEREDDTFPVNPARRWKHALNYMVEQWDVEHGRILPTREPWESDESLNERRRAVISAHTLPDRPAPSAATLAKEIAKEDAAEWDRLWDQAERRATFLAAVKTHAFGAPVDLPEPFLATNPKKTRRSGTCWYDSCTQPAPVEIRRDPAKPGPDFPGIRTGYLACAFHYAEAAEIVCSLTDTPSQVP